MYGVLQVGTFLGLTAASSAPAGKAGLPVAAEKLLENACAAPPSEPAGREQILEVFGAHARSAAPLINALPPRPRRPLSDAGRSVFVILATLLFVAQDVVGLLYLLEANFGRRVVGISIGMMLLRELAILALDLIRLGIAADTENLVTVAF